MNAAEMAAYRAQLKRERTLRRMLKAIWFVATVAIALVYEEFFGIDSVWVTCLCIGIIQSTILDRRKIDAKQYRKLMEDDAALRAKWYEEYDERMLTINMRAGIPFVEYMNMALELAALVALPFSVAGCVTLLAVSFVQTLASAVVRGCWVRKLTGAEAGEEDA